MDEHVDRIEFEHKPPSVSQPTGVRRWWLKWLLLAFCCVAIAFGLRFILARHATPPPHRAATAAQPVGAATISTGDIRVILNELGTVSPLDTVTVKTQINGQLTQVAFQEGQLVKKGDFLAQIDDRVYQAQSQRDQGQLAHDQGLLAQAQADLQRFQILGRQDSIAQQQVQDQRYLVQQDAGTVKADQATVATDQINIAYCHIVSPIDGRVGLRQIDAGNYVQSSDASGIVVITQMQPMSVVFSVPQQNLAEIEDRVAHSASLDVDAYDQANTTLIDQGKLATIDNQMDTSTGTVKMRAVFPNDKNQLFPNEFVNAHLLVNTLANVVRVPVPAVQLGVSGTFVWVINQDSSVASRPVKLGAVDGQYQQIISGLKAGERVVTDGTDRLRDGMKVSIPTAQSAAPAAAPPGQQPHRNGPRAPRRSGGAQPG